MASRKSTMDKVEAREQLRALLPPGSTAYTILRHVSASGMSRRISVVALENVTYYRATKANGGKLHRTREAAGLRARRVEIPEPRYLDWMVAAVLDYRIHDDSGLIVSGCGMDMGFHVVYGLAATLYGYEDGAAYSISHRWI